MCKDKWNWSTTSYITNITQLQYNHTFQGSTDQLLVIACNLVGVYHVDDKHLRKYLEVKAIAQFSSNMHHSKL